MSYVDELMKLIIEDKNKINTYDRYPVRFLFMKLYNDTFREIKDLYSKFMSESTKNQLFNQIEIIKLSDLLSFNDAWLTRQKLYDKIANLDNDKDYLILGFSELARFYSKSDLQSLILSFMTDIESINANRKQRIYFVCFSLYEKLEEVLKINGRNANINPIICPSGFMDSDSICVYYANSNFASSSINKNIINNTSDWLSLYEAKGIDYTQGIVCLSDTLVTIYEKAKPDNFVEIYKIDSYFSLLVRMCGMSLTNKDETKFDDSFWKKIFDLTKKYLTISVKTIALKYLGVQDINCDNFISIFNKCDDFGKKILLLYLYENENDIIYSYYLIELLENSLENSFKTFVSDIVIGFNNLFDTAKFDARRFFVEKLFEEKCINREFKQDGLLKTLNACFNSYLLTQIFNSKLEDEDLLKITSDTFTKKYNQDSNYVNTVIHGFFNKILSKVLIGKFQIEQYVIMNLLSNWYISVDEAVKVYPDLELYLGNSINPYINSSKYWLSEYIFEYRLSKILSSGTTKFVSFSQRNDEEFMYRWYLDSSLQHQQDLINHNKYDHLIVLDGVGIEYFDFITGIIQKNNRFVNYADYAKAYLPSITSINKAKIDGYDKWIIDFDKEVIHGTIYNNIKTIPDSLSYLKNLIIKLIEDYPNSAICITADHGCTCQSKIIDTQKKYNFKSNDHEGRCMEIIGSVDHIAKSNDYCVYSDIVTNKNYLISLNNYSLDDRPIHECHGGGTVEECFVPCIVFSTNKELKNYNVRTLKTTVNGLDKKIIVEINPKPSKLPIFVEENGIQGLLTLEKDNTWSAVITRVTSQRVKIIIDDFEYQFDVTSSSGISKRGDDGFDD